MMERDLRSSSKVTSYCNLGLAGAGLGTLCTRTPVSIIRQSFVVSAVNIEEAESQGSAGIVVSIKKCPSQIRDSWLLLRRRRKVPQRVECRLERA